MLKRISYTSSQYNYIIQIKLNQQNNNRYIIDTPGCGCGAFDSNFLCAACDKHWEEHETFFETAEMRKENGLPVGKTFRKL